MFEHFRRFGGRYVSGIQLAALVGIFLYFFAENFVLSEGWDVLTLRSIDDFAMHDSVRGMQKAIATRNIGRVLTFFDYGYGNVFWLANAILFMPFYWFDSPQLQIVLGRQISLILVFASIYLIGKIAEKLRPDDAYLKYPILICLAAGPMIAIVGTKLHVNSQSLFFAVLSFYMLVRADTLDGRSVRKAAIFGGISAGLKLTGVLIFPLLGLTVLARYWQQGEKNILRQAIVFGGTLLLVTIGCALPALLLFPFFWGALKGTYATFLLYKNMGAGFSMDPLVLVADAISYYMHPIVFIIAGVLYGVLAADCIRRRQINGAALLLGLGLACAVISLAVTKAPLYVATYALNIAFFIPLGLLGLGSIKMPSAIRWFAACVIVLGGIYFSQDFRERALPYHRFYEMQKSAQVVEQLRALDAMRKVVGSPQRPLRILQDNTAVFPLTRFSKGVDVVYCYGDLRTHASDKAVFDFIVLNTKEYFGKMALGATLANTLPSKAEVDARDEERIRNQLHEGRGLPGSGYKLIYEGHDTVLYQRVPG